MRVRLPALLILVALALAASPSAAAAREAPATPPETPATPEGPATLETPEVPEAPGGFIAARVPERGETALLLVVGRPFSSISLDHGLFSRLTVGLGFDLASGGFSRAGAHLRVRALRLGRAELSARFALSAVLPQANSGFGRAIARTGDGELDLQISYAPLASLAFFGEGGVLGETDFGRPRTAAFLELSGGAEWVAFGPFALIGRLGMIRGGRGTARTFSAGGGVHF
jgi:hypothetical protein